MSQASSSVLARYEPTIGLEVHCQLQTKSKLFCSCPTTFGQEPNANTCPVCLGHPGVLPVPNTEAINFAIKLALAVGAKIRGTSVFARKQYFYPDLPKGYQLSQYDLPYCEGGGLELDDKTFVELTRIHLEEDAGKNIHEGGSSFVDLNRAGIPLLEVVTNPVITSAAAAAEYLRKLRAIVRYIGICDGNLEEGSFRCDANVSIKPRGAKGLGTRCEIKNLNSFKNIERAINYEILRQADLLDHGQKVVQQTLLFDAAAGRTQAMRSKEESQDYRYFPDPDLRPLVITDERIERIKVDLPELPRAKAERFMEQYQLPVDDALILTADRDFADYFEKVVTLTNKAVTPKVVANWINTELLRVMKEQDVSPPNYPVSAEHFGELLGLLGEGVISGKIAKTVFEHLVTERKSPKAIVAERGLLQNSDVSMIKDAVTKVVDANPQQVEQYLSGKDKILGFFVGQIMKAGQGKYSPDLVNSLLREILDAKRSQ